MMQKFKDSFIDVGRIRGMKSPDFGNILSVLRREKPSRYTLFETYLNDPLEDILTGVTYDRPWWEDQVKYIEHKALAFEAAGYDYVTINSSNFHFKTNHYKRFLNVIGFA